MGPQKLAIVPAAELERGRHVGDPFPLHLFDSAWIDLDYDELITTIDPE
jgi:hypothetical protein